MSGLAVLTHAGSPAEAAILKAILEENGIPAFVGDGPLMDEFAASQRVLGNLGCAVQVPEVAIEEAKALLEAHRENVARFANAEERNAEGPGAGDA